jgi:CHAT domain-containing protein
MGRFYREVRDGGTLPGALQSAKRALHEHTASGTIVTGNERVSYAHPYFWAPFVMIGGDSLVPFRRPVD